MPDLDQHARQYEFVAKSLDDLPLARPVYSEIFKTMQALARPGKKKGLPSRDYLKAIAGSGDDKDLLEQLILKEVSRAKTVINGAGASKDSLKLEISRTVVDCADALVNSELYGDVADILGLLPEGWLEKNIANNHYEVSDVVGRKADLARVALVAGEIDLAVNLTIECLDVDSFLGDKLMVKRSLRTLTRPFDKEINRDNVELQEYFRDYITKLMPELVSKPEHNKKERKTRDSRLKMILSTLPNLPGSMARNGMVDEARELLLKASKVMRKSDVVDMICQLEPDTSITLIDELYGAEGQDLKQSTKDKIASRSSLARVAVARKSHKSLHDIK